MHKTRFTYTSIAFLISSLLFSFSLIFPPKAMISSGIYLISLAEPVILINKKDYVAYLLISLSSIPILFISPLKYVVLVPLFASLIILSLKNSKMLIPSSLLITSLIPFISHGILEEMLFFSFILIPALSLGFVTKRVHSFVTVPLALLSMLFNPYVGLASSSILASLMAFYFVDKENVCPFTSDAGLVASGGFIAGGSIVLIITLGWNIYSSSIFILGTVLLLSGSLKPRFTPKTRCFEKSST
ncbi:MAG: hypothetical protein F7B61_00705 [Caldisphaeraceae archaeon]|nr:hypothetical protein [Caldisphaeraceae archaeon]